MKFYHVIDNKRNSGITIATEVVAPPTDVPATQGGQPVVQVDCAISYCAPVEQNFSRPRGRLITSNRMANPKELPGFKRFSFYTCSQNGLKAQALGHLQSHMPEASLGWARSLVSRELERLQSVALRAALEETVP